MRNKQLTLLAIAAVVMASLAVIQTRFSRQAQQTDFGSAPLVPGLNIDAVATIEVAAAGSKVTLIRRGDGFVVAEKDNYPADVMKINELINNCLDIRVTDKITSNAANHADLKVTEEAAGAVVSFLAADGKPIVSAIVSPTNMETDAAYGRLAGSDDVYAIASPPRFSTGPMEYIRRDLVRVSRSEIASVAVKTANGSYVLRADEASNAVTLENMPGGKQFKGSDYTAVFGALSGLRIEDVQAENAVKDLTFDAGYTCRLKDLKVYKLQLAKKDDAVYAKVSATYLDETPVEKTVGQVETDEQLKAKEAKLLAIDAVKAFTAEHKGWVYKIPSYHASNLTKPLADLLEDIPAEEPADKADAAAGP